MPEILSTHHSVPACQCEFESRNSFFAHREIASIFPKICFSIATSTGLSGSDVEMPRSNASSAPSAEHRGGRRRTASKTQKSLGLEPLSNCPLRFVPPRARVHATVLILIDSRTDQHFRKSVDSQLTFGKTRLVSFRRAHLCFLQSRNGSSRCEKKILQLRSREDFNDLDSLTSGLDWRSLRVMTKFPMELHWIFLAPIEALFQGS